MSKILSMKERASLATKSVGNAASSSPMADSPIEKKVHSGPANSILAMLSDSRVGDENKNLKEELSAWEGAFPTKRLDPALVLPSRWANRHADSFQGKDFDDLKADIESAGGNVQGIKVRPISNTHPQRYEIVFGHRRHRACLDLGLPVLSVIDDIDEKTLFAEMDRENRQRADLRPYEQGEMYRRALDESLYSSARKLAEALGISVTTVTRAVNIARLPAEVLDAFHSRLDIQYRWVESLSAVVLKDSELLIARAKEVRKDREDGRFISSKQIFDRLVSAAAKGTGSRAVFIEDRKILTITATKNKVAFELGSLNDGQIKSIEEFILKTLAV